MIFRIKERQVELLDQSDRNTIRQVCNLMGLIFKDEWFETKDFLTIPAWGRRFWFKRGNNKEYISKIEEFRRC